jgi:hypothetical protein
MTQSVELGIRQFVDAWRTMCAGAPARAEATTADVHYVFSGLPLGFFNIALLTGQQISAEALQAHAREASAWAATQRVPWLFVVTHERLAPGLDAAAMPAPHSPQAKSPGTRVIWLSASTRIPPMK